MSGCSSGVEHNLAKVGVERSNRFTRSIFSKKYNELTGLYAHRLPQFDFSGSTWAARALVVTQRLSSVVALSVLAGCQTGAEYQADVNASLNARLEAYNGATMAEFQARTGMLPVDAYPVSEGQVFVFRTDPVYMTLPATHVTPAFTRSA